MQAVTLFTLYMTYIIFIHRPAPDKKLVMVQGDSPLRDSLMRYGATTRLSPERAMEKAKEYFGRLELVIEEQSSAHVHFKGANGFVQIKVETVNGTELDIETKGFDLQVKEFLQRIG